LADNKISVPRIENGVSIRKKLVSFVGQVNFGEPVYGSRYSILVNPDEEAATRFCGCEVGNARGMTVADGLRFRVWLADGDDMNTLGHEAYHCVEFVREHIGHVDHRDGGGEPMAYYMGWLMGQLIGRICKHESGVKLQS